MIAQQREIGELRRRLNTSSLQLHHVAGVASEQRLQQQQIIAALETDIHQVYAAGKEEVSSLLNQFHTHSMLAEDRGRMVGALESELAEREYYLRQSAYHQELTKQEQGIQDEMVKESFLNVTQT